MDFQSGKLLLPILHIAVFQTTQLGFHFSWAMKKHSLGTTLHQLLQNGGKMVTQHTAFHQLAHGGMKGTGYNISWLA